MNLHEKYTNKYRQHELNGVLVLRPHSQLKLCRRSPLHTRFTIKSVVAVDLSVPSLKKSRFFHLHNHCGGAVFNIIIRRTEMSARIVSWFR